MVNECIYFYSWCFYVVLFALIFSEFVEPLVHTLAHINKNNQYI